MRVVCILHELMSALGKDEAQIAKEIGIDKRSVRKLLANHQDWRLPRHTLEKLMLFAFANHYPKGIFEIRPHPLWDTFDDAPITIFRGSRTWDTDAEAKLRRFLENLNHHPDTEVATDSEPGVDIAAIQGTMENHNCIFIGSPKTNPPSEIALALLWNAVPFDHSAENRQAIPIHILGMMPELHERSAILEPSTRNGFDLRLSSKQDRRFIRVSWETAEKYGDWTGQGEDAAVVVVAKDPFDTGRSVTTIVISGYTGRATFLASKELIYGEPPITKEDLMAPEPVIATFLFYFRKLPYRGGRTLAGLRREIPGTERWMPR